MQDDLGPSLQGARRHGHGPRCPDRVLLEYDRRGILGWAGVWAMLDCSAIWFPPLRGTTTCGTTSSASSCGHLSHAVISLSLKTLLCSRPRLRGATLAPAGPWLCSGCPNAGPMQMASIRRVMLAAMASWYPTRLLDLSTLGETGRVLLVVTKLLDHASLDQGEYITLSHCWGEWGAKELPVLTTSNIDERVERGMDFSLLPPTFRDAIDVAGWFNSKKTSPPSLLAAFNANWSNVH